MFLLKSFIIQILIQGFFLSYFAYSAPNNFNKSKNLLRDKVYGHKGSTFYCQCDYQKKTIKTKSCKLNIQKYKKRLKRLEWEHVVPAHAFGQSFKEWRDAKTLCKREGKKSLSPRKCTKKLNSLFSQMEANVYNIVPVVGAVNALRSNYSFSELSNINERKRLCERGFYLDKRKVMPPKDIKGDIARIYFYMNTKYPGRGIISNKNEKLFKAWDSLDPVDKKECELNLSKSKIQGEPNQFVMNKCEDLKTN